MNFPKPDEYGFRPHIDLPNGHKLSCQDHNGSACRPGHSFEVALIKPDWNFRPIPGWKTTDPRQEIYTCRTPDEIETLITRLNANPELLQ